MATYSWIGGVKKTAQVSTYALAGTWEADDINRITIGQKIIDFVAGSTTEATIVDSIVTAWLALSATVYPEFAEITPSRSGDSLVLTAKTAGKPFTCTISPLESDGSTAGDAQTIEGANTPTTGTTATANSGPNAWVAGNFSGGVLPANGDTVIIDRVNTQIYWGLDQSAVTLAELRIVTTPSDQSFILGLPRLNVDGTAYPEYRPDYLKIGATILNITTAGGRTKVDVGTAQTAAHVMNSGAGLENAQGIPAVLLKGTHASNAWEFLKGNIGLAFFGGETATALTLAIGKLTSPTDCVVICGSGCTLGTITKTAGTLQINSAVGTAANIGGGRTIINGTGAVAALNADGEQVIYNTSGTLGGNPALSGGSILDFSQDMTAKAVTNPVVCYDSSDVNDPNKIVTSLAVTYTKTGRLGFGKNITLTRT